MRHYRAIATALVVLLSATSTTASAQGRGRGRGHDEGKHEAAGRVIVVPPAEQARRIEVERERALAYRRNYDGQLAAIRARSAALDAARRAEALRAQQAYAAERARELRELDIARHFDREPYISAPHTYRYVIQGTPRETNQYGVAVLRQSIDNGYQEGYRAGLADHRDRWRYDFLDEAAYRDANYGYRGAYVDQSDYNYYFRQGFRRGYDDGYSSRFQYGTYTNGTYSMLANVLNSILGLSTIR